MPKFLLLLVALAVVATPCRASDVAQELTRIEALRREAIKTGNFGILEQIYAPNFIAVAGNGQVIDRTRLFAIFKQTDPSLVFSTDEVQVQASGSTAVFIGRLTARNSSGAVAFQSRFSHVFIQDGARWVCIAGQSTPIAPS
jgi:ketosteroid isomerase-like protein